METIKRHFRPEQLREFSLVFLIVAIFLFLGSQIEGYFSPRIFNRVTSDVAIITVVALAETLVLLTRNYDLSVGSVVGLSAFTVGKLLSSNQDVLPIVAFDRHRHRPGVGHHQRITGLLRSSAFDYRHPGHHGHLALCPGRLSGQ